MESLTHSGSPERLGFFYNGKSMQSTFRRGDYIYTSPAKLAELRIGDIVVFSTHADSLKHEYLVHRVIRIKNGTVVTRGDYNLAEDSYELSDDRLVGKALFYEREGKRYQVRNGVWGLLRSKRIRLELLTTRWAISLGRPLYQMLKKSRVVPCLWKPDLEEIVLHSPSGKKVKYTHRGKTVLVRDGDRIIFRRRPYDLLF